MSEPRIISVAELARDVGGVLIGDGARVVRRAATLDEADEECVAWLTGADYLPKLETTRAAVVLVPTDLAVETRTTLIRVADPDLTMCDVQRLLGPPAETVPVGVHPTAVVAPDARVAGAAIGPLVRVGPGSEIGPGTQLHAGVYIGADCRIGRDCTLWPNVVIRERSELADRVVVHPNTTIGGDGFGYLQRDGRHVKIPQVGRVVIEEDVEIGANCAVDRARCGVTRIRRGVKIDNLVQIAHNCDLGEGCIVVAQCGISGSTTLGRYVVLAGQVGVVDHIRIGDRVQITAQSGVNRDLPDGDVVYRGTPVVGFHDYGRQQAALRRLPELLKEFRELRKRVRQLEAAANDSTRD